jgi:hypothetical protein
MMQRQFSKLIAISALLLALVSGTIVQADREKVSLVKAPDGGIQPQAALDEQGALHLIYFTGDPAGGDIFYVRQGPGKEGFSKPIRVNSQPGSAVATGTVRGAHLAIGKNGRVHVSWMGSKTAEPKGPANATPMLYARLNDEQTAFEPQRNVMQSGVGLDGGGSVAADRAGNVYVAWHANGDGQGEAHRRVWIARSSDEGKTFSRETAAGRDQTGACGCCGMRAAADRRGHLFLLYRAATEHVNRDMVLLSSTDGGKSFTGTRVHQWKLSTCPMSTASIGQGDGGALIAWETEGQVYYAEVDPAAAAAPRPIAAPGRGGGRKHPAVAGNGRGETILVWTEGTGWKKGGSLAWQVFDKDGKPTEVRGEGQPVGVWSLSRSKNCTVDCLVCGCLCETKHSADNAPLVKGLVPGPWLKTEGLPQTRPLYGTCRDATDSGSISGKFGSTESSDGSGPLRRNVHDRLLNLPRKCRANFPVCLCLRQRAIDENQGKPESWPYSRASQRNLSDSPE